MRRILILGLAALALGAFAWRGGAPPAQATVQPGPPSIGLLQPAVAGCPVGVEVTLPLDATITPGPPSVALFIPPSAAGGGCAQGIVVMWPPGPPVTPGMAFGLPLNAADCDAGTAALNSILTALGGTLPGTQPGTDPATGGTGGSGDACADGTAAMLGIQNARPPGPPTCPAGTIRASDAGPVNRGRGTFVLMPPGPPTCPPATALGIVQDAAGTARGALAVQVNPGPQQLPSLQLFQIVPSGVPGASLVRPPNPN